MTVFGQELHPVLVKCKSMPKDAYVISSVHGFGQVFGTYVSKRRYSIPVNRTVIMRALARRSGVDHRPYTKKMNPSFSREYVLEIFSEVVRWSIYYVVWVIERAAYPLQNVKKQLAND